jgi:hypothetical protein
MSTFVLLADNDPGLDLRQWCRSFGVDGKRIKVTPIDDEPVTPVTPPPEDVKPESTKPAKKGAKKEAKKEVNSVT